MKYKEMTMAIARRHGLKAVVRDNRLISKRRRRPSWWWVDLVRDSDEMVMTAPGSKKRSGVWHAFVLQYIERVPKEMSRSRVTARTPEELCLRLAAEAGI